MRVDSLRSGLSGYQYYDIALELIEQDGVRRKMAVTVGMLRRIVGSGFFSADDPWHVTLLSCMTAPLTVETCSPKALEHMKKRCRRSFNGQSLMT